MWEVLQIESDKTINIKNGKIYLPAEIMKMIQGNLFLMQNENRFGFMEDKEKTTESLHITKRNGQGTITSKGTTEYLNKNGYPDGKYKYRIIEENNKIIFELKRQA